MLITVLLLVSVSITFAEQTRPIVGILALPDVSLNNQKIVASYVKFAELGGSRVLPIFLNQSRKYYEDVVNTTNGIILTGGGLNLTGSSIEVKEYLRSGQILYDLAVEKNLNDDYYPIFGICLGFELVSFLVNQLQWPFTHCDFQDVALNLHFNPSHSSRMMKDASSNIIKIMEQENVTYHYHEWCLSPEKLRDGLLQNFTLIATSKRDSTEIVSIIEANNFPFYATAFHPERVVFEQYPSKSHSSTPSNYNAMIANQYFANFFSKEVRKSPQKFGENEALWRRLIDKVNPKYTAINSSYSQTYYFDYGHILQMI